MEIKEIKVDELNAEKFIDEKAKEISKIVGQHGYAISALSGGVDSSVATILGHKALGEKLEVYFIDNGLMRKGEPENVVSLFKTLGINVKSIQAQAYFFSALKGITDPEEKREAITKAFYKDVFRLISLFSDDITRPKYLLQGTILTDIEETVAGIKRQHNVFEQIGINPQKEFGYGIIEPLIQLRKDGVRKVAKALGLPASIYNRMPFPGPALAARVYGEVTPGEISIIRKATAIVEEELAITGAFQYMAILHKDEATGIENGKRKLGRQIEIRCWDSIDARRAEPTRLSYRTKRRLIQRLVTEIPDVVSVTFNETPKPPSTMEAI